MGLHNRFPIAQWIIDRLHEENFDGFEMHYQSKKPDGLLHPSTDLGCEIAMCHGQDPDIPDKPQSTASLQRLLTGTLWHAWLQGQWESGGWDGIEARCEVKMGEGLPPGWQGSCDLLLGQFGDGKLSEAEWTIFDFKTIAGSGLGFIDLNVPKPEQHNQISAYFHAAEAMGYRMNPEVCVVHIPISAAQYKEMEPPIEQWMKPLPRNVIYGEMKRRSQVLKAYLNAKEEGIDMGYMNMPQEMPKVNKTRFNKKLNLTEQTEEPSWLVKYCRSSQCACAGQTKDVIAYAETEGAGSL
jgi:hypothetical protein